MRRHLAPIALVLALLSVAACASATTDAPRPALDGPCPTCGRAPVPAAEPIRFEPSCWVPADQWSWLPPQTLGDQPPAVALPDDEALEKARVDGAYSELLRKVHVPGDYLYYGEFSDYGRWDGTAYAGYDGLPPGDWVYVYPHWYVWESTVGDTLRAR